MSTKSQVESWLGVALAIIQILKREVWRLGGNDGHLRKLTTPAGEILLAELATKLVGLVRQCFRVVVDYTRNLGQMIEAGKYDWVNNDITQEHFPVQGQGKQEKEVELFHFGKTMSSDDVIAEMDKDGYRPAILADLLALGESKPDLQREFPIVALGSVWVDSAGGRYVAVLYGGGSERALLLNGFGSDWREDDRFAAVRK